MFKDLPETIPHKNKRKLETFAGALVLQIVLVAGLIVAQMAMPEKLGEFQLLETLYMAPPPPPPPAPVSAAPELPKRHSRPESKNEAAAPTAPTVVEKTQPVEKEPEVIAPTTIPKDIARLVESGSVPSPGAVGPARVGGGVPGGVPGGVGGGVLNGVLGGAATPPPVAPPKEPVRVGGNVKPPKLVHVEQPEYPAPAKSARIEGVVVVEAVVTADGSVEKVKVISGPAQLVDAAIAAVSKWKYEPTYLNGQAVPVILTARINFSLSNTQK